MKSKVAPVVSWLLTNGRTLIARSSLRLCCPHAIPCLLLIVFSVIYCGAQTWNGGTGNWSDTRITGALLRFPTAAWPWFRLTTAIS